MGCGAAEAIDLGFVCFVVVNPCVFLAGRVILSFFFVFANFPILRLLSSFSIGCSCLLLLVFLFFVCLEFQINRFVFSTFTPVFFIEISFVLPPPPHPPHFTPPSPASISPDNKIAIEVAAPTTANSPVRKVRRRLGGGYHGTGFRLST